MSEHDRNRGQRRGAVTTAVILGLLALGFYLAFIVIQVGL